MDQFIPRSALPIAAQRQMQAQAFEVPFPYFSTVKLATRVTGDGDFVLPRGTVVSAFSYGRGQLKTAAGFTTEDGEATEADTNLTQQGQTVSGEMVHILGMACQIVPRSLDIAPGATDRVIAAPDSEFLGALFESLSLELSLNGGRETFQLGTLGMVPGAGGLVGGGIPTNQPPGLDQNQQIAELFPNNGLAVGNNTFRMPRGIKWRPQGQRDSQLSIIFRNTREIVISQAAPRLADNTPAEVATGVEAYTPPDVLAVTIKVFLDGLTTSPRSDVS